MFREEGNFGRPLKSFHYATMTNIEYGKPNNTTSQCHVSLILCIHHCCTLSYTPPTGCVWHKAFFSWVRAQTWMEYRHDLRAQKCLEPVGITPKNRYLRRQATKLAPPWIVGTWVDGTLSFEDTDPGAPKRNAGVSKFMLDTLDPLPTAPGHTDLIRDKTADRSVS